MKTRSVLDALIEFSNLENGECPDKLRATFRDGEQEYYVTFCNERLMFECYGWEGMVWCTFVSECFPKDWKFVGWRFAFDSFTDLTDRVLSGASAQDLIDEFKSKMQKFEARLNKITDIIKKHEQKERAMAGSYKCPLCGTWPILRTDGLGKAKYRISCKCEDSYRCRETVEEAVNAWRECVRLVCRILKKEYREESR